MVSSLLMYPTCCRNRQSSLGRANNAISFEQSIFSEIHESTTFSTAFAFDSYLTLYLYANGVAVSEVVDTLTHARTQKLSTVTLAAHARRRLMKRLPPTARLPRATLSNYKNKHSHDLKHSGTLTRQALSKPSLILPIPTLQQCVKELYTCSVQHFSYSASRTAN